MKFASVFMFVVIVGFGPDLWAQISPSPATAPAAASPPGSADNPAVVDSDDSAPNKPAALGEFLRPGIGVGGAAAGMAGANRETTGPVSVLCFKEPDQKALGETTEDVAVLAVLLSRNLEEAFAVDASDYKLGIPMLLTSGKQAIGASYIQGFGAILKMQVRFPVVAPPDGAERTQPEKTASEWEEARRELLADENGGNSYWEPRTAGRQKAGQGYDAKLVETLKKRVLVLLKNGANLRHVDGNEWIIVKIVGTPNPGRTVRTVAKVKERNLEPSDNSESSSPASAAEPGAGATASATQAKKSHKHSNNDVRGATAVVETVPASSRATVLTLRVKKSAADALASGKLSEDQFVSQAEVAAYLNPAPPNPRITSFPDTAGY